MQRICKIAITPITFLCLTWSFHILWFGDVNLLCTVYIKSISQQPQKPENAFTTKLQIKYTFNPITNVILY